MKLAAQQSSTPRLRRKLTYLTIVLKPLRSNLGDGVIRLGGAAWHSGQTLRHASPHRGENRIVDWFVQGGSFL